MKEDKREVPMFQMKDKVVVYAVGEVTGMEFRNSGEVKLQITYPNYTGTAYVDQALVEKEGVGREQPKHPDQ